MENKPLEVLLDKFPELTRWIIESICRYRHDKIEDFIVADYKENILRLTLYTRDYSYHISARLPNVEKMGDGEMLSVDGYLGCQAQCRKPRAGEDWTRGSDLPDGSYSEETWRRIINAIIAYELVKVVKPKKLKKI